MTRWLLLPLGVAIGCGGSQPQPAPDPPLSIADWKQLPPEQKYSGEILERVRASDPKFADDPAWEKFLTSTVWPARTKELTKK